MSEAPQPRLYQFGPWPELPADPAPQASPLGQRVIAWMRGEDVEVDADVSRILRREFHAQEQYRRKLTERISEARGIVEKKATKAVDDAGDEPLDINTAFASGYKRGEYESYMRAAQVIQDCINDVALMAMEQRKEQ